VFLRVGAADGTLLTVKKILICQLLVIVTVFLGFAVVLGEDYARSSLLGGMAALIPNAYFGIKISRLRNACPRQILNAFYVGEAGKLALTLAFFIVIFQMSNIKVLPLLGSYAAALSVFWFALLIR